MSGRGSRPLALHLFNRGGTLSPSQRRSTCRRRSLYADDTNPVRGYIRRPREIARGPRRSRLFRSARAALRALHRPRISHHDLAKEQNWRRTPDGHAYLLDFQLASVSTPHWGFVLRAAREDLRHFLNTSAAYIPTLDPADAGVLARKSLPPASA